MAPETIIQSSEEIEGWNEIDSALFGSGGIKGFQTTPLFQLETKNFDNPSTPNGFHFLPLSMEGLEMKEISLFCLP